MIKIKTQTRFLLPTTPSGYFRTESAQLLAAANGALWQLPGLELGWSLELSYVSYREHLLSAKRWHEKTLSLTLLQELWQD